MLSIRRGPHASLEVCVYIIGPARASFVKNPTDGAHINLRQPLKNKAFYEAKVALHFDLSFGYKSSKKCFFLSERLSKM